MVVVRLGESQKKIKSCAKPNVGKVHVTVVFGKSHSVVVSTCLIVVS